MIPPKPVPPREPTTDECSANTPIEIEPSRVGTAAWYPSMGGYVGRCVVEPESTGCATVWVWHDGSFPFSGDDGSPTRLHHCNGGDFIRFGQLLQRLAGSTEQSA